MKGGVLALRDIKSLEGYNITIDTPIYKYISNNFVFNNKNLIDYNWIELQMKYIDSLSDRQKHILRAYTIYGDNFINNYIKNTLTKELIINTIKDMIKYNENLFLYQHKDKTGQEEINNIYVTNIIIYIKQFIYELNEIINNSPKLNMHVRIFRGIKDGTYIIKNTKYINNKKLYTNKEFISTTIYVPSAINFMENECCLLELNLYPNTHCIFTGYISRRRGEYEITLGTNSVMEYIKCTKKYLIEDYELYNNTNVFINPKQYNLKVGNVCEFNVYN